MLFLITLASKGKETMSAQRQDHRGKAKHFSYNFYTCTEYFIHLLGSSLIQWMVSKINKRQEQKRALRLGGDLCLSEVAFAKARQKLDIFRASDSPRQTDLLLGEELRLDEHSFD